MGQNRILIADGNVPFARTFAQSLRGRGFDTKVTTNCQDAQGIIDYWKPEFVFVDLLLPDNYAYSLLKFVNAQPKVHRPKIIVMSRQSVPTEVEAVIKAGASHYLVKPFRFKRVLGALRAVTAEKKAPGAFSPEKVPSTFSEAKQLETPIDVKATSELHILDLFLRQVNVSGKESAMLHNLMRMIGLRVGALRCSLTRCLNAETGLVMASNDDEAITGHNIHLVNYPELREVRRTGHYLIIGNVKSADLMSPVKHQLNHKPYETMAVFPIYCHGQFWGTLSLRLEQKTRAELIFIAKFGQVCAQIISLRLSSQKELAA